MRTTSLVLCLSRYSHYFVAHRSNSFVVDKLLKIPGIQAASAGELGSTRAAYFGLQARGKSLGKIVVEEHNWVLIGLVLGLTGLYAVSFFKLLRLLTNSNTAAAVCIVLSVFYLTTDTRPLPTQPLNLLVHAHT
jgi:hypothetical protein